MLQTLAFVQSHHNSDFGNIYPKKRYCHCEHKQEEHFCTKSLFTYESRLKMMGACYQVWEGREVSSFCGFKAVDLFKTILVAITKIRKMQSNIDHDMALHYQE